MLPRLAPRRHRDAPADLLVDGPDPLGHDAGPLVATLAGPDLPPSQRLVERLAGGVRHPDRTRRSFLTRVAVTASALAVNPFDFVFKPGTAYASVCGDGTGCSSGWTVFCCTVNNGSNTCPPGSFVAGWWKADGSSFCGGASRYIIDCNATCPTQCSCRCASGTCDDRRVCCNQFRYGQCNQQITCYGPVVCRVATCTPPWIYDSACTTASATDNRTRTHSAPCLDPAPPPPPPPPPPSPALRTEYQAGPGVGIQGDGRLEVFALGSDRSLAHSWQVRPNGTWSGFFPFPGRAGGTPGVASNQDGRLEVFYVRDDGILVHDWQTKAGMGATWSGPWPLHQTRFEARSGVAAGRNQDGRLEAFVVGTDRRLYHTWQTSPNNGWSGVFPLQGGGGNFRGNPGLGVNADGRLEVFVVGEDGRLFHNWQVRPNGSWSGWWPLEGSFATGTAPGVGQNADGRLEVFVVARDGALVHNWQVRPNGTWSGWHSMGGSFVGTPGVGRNQDGRLEAFAANRSDGKLSHSWQLAPNGGWSGWFPL